MIANLPCWSTVADRAFFFRLFGNAFGHRELQNEGVHGDVRSCGADVLEYRLALRVVVKAKDHLLTRAELQIMLEAREVGKALR